MKAATTNELKQELMEIPPARLIELCLRLVRFKKENKELLTYLLFEAHDTEAYINGIKKEMDVQFESINIGNVYFVKKSLRKILRFNNKFIRYSNSDIVETELLIYFCLSLKKMGSTINNNLVIHNIYQNQLKKIKKAIAAMHEDLQYDYLKEMESLG
jgi:hypothetical protein